MKILPVQYNTYTQKLPETKSKQVLDNSFEQKKVAELTNNYPVYFKASAVDVDAEKARLKHLVDDLASPFDKENFMNYFKKVFGLEKSRLGKIAIQYTKDKTLTKEEYKKKMDAFIGRTTEELCQRTIDEMNAKGDRIYEQNIEPSLLNQFKSAIDSGNFNLREVHKNFYKSLYNIDTVKELHEQYPYMPVPLDPRIVIASRLLTTIPEKDIQTLAEVIKTDDIDKINSVADNIIEGLYPLCQKYMTHEQFDKEIYNSAVNILSKGMVEYIQHPFKIQTVNPKTFCISDEELGLLKFDYDTYVMTVLRAILSDGEDIKNISCSIGDYKIYPAQIKDSVYRFKQPIPNQINKILMISDKIKRGERDYDRFGEKQLRSRLEFYENSHIAQDEAVLETMMNFEYSKLLPEDLTPLRLLLRALDKVKDGDMTIDDYLKYAREQDLTPKGQQRLDKLEMEQLEAQIKERQKYEEELFNLRETHSNMVLFLHSNKLAKAANILTGYYPQDIQNPYMDEMLELINSHILPDGTIFRPELLEKQIVYLDKFNSAKLQNNPLLESVLNFCKGDKLKAGQYFYNLELVKSYPKQTTTYFDRNLLNVVIEEINGDINTPVEDYDNQKLIAKYLTRYSTYNEMPENDKKILSEFIEKFDEEDEIDRAVMKYLVSEKYINEDTEIIFKNNDVEIPVIFSATAKRDIFERYKYPKCIDYFIAFEHALSRSSNSAGTSGLKIIGQNNEKIRGFEVKIAMDKDRLYSSDENPYYFDVYDFYGLHD